MKRITIVAAAGFLLLVVPVGRCAPSEAKNPEEPMRNETEVQKERSPVTQKQDPQPPPQITFPRPPFFPFRPDASLTPAMPQLPFTFPFLFPSFVPRPTASVRSLSLPVETFVISDAEDELRRSPTTDKKKPKKKKKKQQKKPKPLVVYQKENQVALESPSFQPGIAGQLSNGNQGSYMGYYMVYLVEITWNGSNQTQTIIAGRPVLAANPPPTESAQITDLSGSIMTESPFKPPPPTTQCFFQRSTTADLSGVAKPPFPTDHPDQEIISEELETGEEYDEEDPKKKKKKQKKSNTDAPISHPT